MVSVRRLLPYFIRVRLENLAQQSSQVVQQVFDLLFCRIVIFGGGVGFFDLDDPPRPPLLTKYPLR